MKWLFTTKTLQVTKTSRPLTIICTELKTTKGIIYIQHCVKIYICINFNMLLFRNTIFEFYRNLKKENEKSLAQKIKERLHLVAPSGQRNKNKKKKLKKIKPTSSTKCKGITFHTKCFRTQNNVFFNIKIYYYCYITVGTISVLFILAIVM